VEGGLAYGYWFWLEPDVLADFGLVCYVVILTTTSSEMVFVTSGLGSVDFGLLNGARAISASSACMHFSSRA